MGGIEKRKQRHIRLSLEENVQADIGTGFEGAARDRPRRGEH